MLLISELWAATMAQDSARQAERARLTAGCVWASESDCGEVKKVMETELCSSCRYMVKRTVKPITILCGMNVLNLPWRSKNCINTIHIFTTQWILSIWTPYLRTEIFQEIFIGMKSIFGNRTNRTLDKGRVHLGAVQKLFASQENKANWNEFTNFTHVFSVSESCFERVDPR